MTRLDSLVDRAADRVLRAGPLLLLASVWFDFELAESVAENPRSLLTVVDLGLLGWLSGLGWGAAHFWPIVAVPAWAIKVARTRAVWWSDAAILVAMVAAVYVGHSLVRIGKEAHVHFGLGVPLQGLFN